MMRNISNNFIKVGYNSTNDANLVKETQKLLRGTDCGILPRKMLDNVLQSMLESKPVVSELCNEVNNWLMRHNDKIVEVSYKLPEAVIKLIEQIKREEDFVSCYIFDDDRYNIWIIIDEADYDSSAKYIRISRETLGDQYSKYDVMIYSSDEIDEVIDELEGSDYDYKEIKNG